MAVVEELIRAGPTAKLERDDQGRSFWVATRIWQVELEFGIRYAPYSAVLAVSQNEATIGDAYPLNANMTLWALTPAPTGSREVWLVTGEYRQVFDEPPELTGSPLLAPKRLSWGSSSYTVPVVVDKDGDPVANSAGYPFDPPVTDQAHVLTATISYNSDTFDPNLSQQYQDTVNEAAVRVGNLDVGAREAKCVEIGATREYWGSFAYWAVTIKIEIRPATWDRDLLDQGIFEIDAVTGDTLRMKTDEGEEVTEPILMDGFGHKLSPQTAAPVFLSFRTYPEKDFSVLDLAVA